jgi:hypothetical protein
MSEPGAGVTASVRKTSIRRFSMLYKAEVEGRTKPPQGAEGAQSLSARGANPRAPRGRLERLLGHPPALPIKRIQHNLVSPMF